MAIGIVALGAHVPPLAIGNEQIHEWSGVGHDWIDARTGIVERRYADADTPTSALAHRAVLDLVARYPTALDDVGFIILATSTPDRPQPPTAATLQAAIGLHGIPALDVNAVCAGFLFGITTGAALARDLGKAVLVVAADKYSSILDKRDPRTVSLFGDGAGAVVLGPVNDHFGVISSALVTHAEYQDAVKVVGGGSAAPLTAATIEAGEHYFRMDGRTVKEYVLATLPDLLVTTLADCGRSIRDVDRFVFHQANPRLLQALRARLDVDESKLPITAHRFGNCAAASLPVTLAATHAADPLQPGDTVVLAAIGGGMSAGVVVVVWGG